MADPPKLTIKTASMGAGDTSMPRLSSITTAKIVGISPNLRANGTGSLRINSVEGLDDGLYASFEEMERDDAVAMGEIYQTLISDEETGIKAAARAEWSKFADASDSQYYFCMVFQSREARDQFLQHVKWATDLRSEYVCGEDVAKLMGVPITARIPPMPKGKKNRRLEQLADPMIEENDNG